MEGASSSGFVLTVGARDNGVLFAGTQARGAIVVFVSDARVAVVKKSAGKVRMITPIDGGRRCASGAEQMGRHVYADRFTGELRDQAAEVLRGQLPACGELCGKLGDDGMR
jgi:hypothetical protein